jgi:2-keto-4-pentenoate hydratase/2-oxohepta-3-ene-1,7-dioic acid hydratase in catechol pathway
MKFVRFLKENEVSYGILENNRITQLADAPYESIQVTTTTYPLSAVRLLAPSTPTKVLALALNYESHVREARKPTKPEPFLKTTSCIIGPEDPIVLPKFAGTVHEEAELVVVIGKKCRQVSQQNALDYVFGYTCGNDVSARVWQRGDTQWWRAKSSDTFGPIGPCIVTDIDGSSLDIWARVNGKQVQHCNTSELLFDIPTLVSFISQVIALDPGDLIFTGTSGVPVEIQDGDIVEIEVDKIGVLSNPVVAERG